MPAVSVHVPKYCLHKARGLAYVRDHGKVRYLGKHGSSESKEAYGRFLIEWQARRVGVPLPLPKSSADLMVVELCAAYLDYAEGYYRKNGQPTRSLDNIKLAIRPLKAMYGHELVSEFSPLQLLAIQERLATAKCTLLRQQTGGGSQTNVQVGRQPNARATDSLLGIGYRRGTTDGPQFCSRVQTRRSGCRRSGRRHLAPPARG